MEYSNEHLNANALLSVDELIHELMFSPIIPEDFDFEDEVVQSKISSLINEVSAEVESYIKRPLGRQEYVENVTLSVNPQIQVTHRPIKEVKEIASQFPISVDEVMKYTDRISLDEGTLQVGKALVFGDKRDVHEVIGAEPDHQLHGFIDKERNWDR